MIYKLLLNLHSKLRDMNVLITLYSCARHGNPATPGPVEETLSSLPETFVVDLHTKNVRLDYLRCEQMKDNHKLKATVYPISHILIYIKSHILKVEYSAQNTLLSSAVVIFDSVVHKAKL